MVAMPVTPTTAAAPAPATMPKAGAAAPATMPKAGAAAISPAAHSRKFKLRCILRRDRHRHGTDGQGLGRTEAKLGCDQPCYDGSRRQCVLAHLASSFCSGWFGS